MRLRPDPALRALLLFCICAAPCSRIAAADPPAAPAAARAPAPAASVPDYGGKDDPGALASAGTDVPDPLAQVGRSLLALVIVLGGAVGVMVLLKRAGYSGGPLGAALAAGLRKPVSASAGVAAGPLGPMSLVQSQTLPGGGTVHLLAINEKSLVLIGATGQNVSLLAEWDQESEAPASEPAPERPNDFAGHLARIDARTVAHGLTPASPATISDLLSASRERAAQENYE